MTIGKSLERKNQANIEILDSVAQLKTECNHWKTRAEAAEKHVAFLRDALGEERQSVWRDVKLSASTEEAVSAVLGWQTRAEKLEAALERIAKESMDYQYVAQAALEAKP